MLAWESVLQITKFVSQNWPVGQETSNEQLQQTHLDLYLSLCYLNFNAARKILFLLVLAVDLLILAWAEQRASFELAREQHKALLLLVERKWRQLACFARELIGFLICRRRLKSTLLVATAHAACNPNGPILPRQQQQQHYFALLSAPIELSLSVFVCTLGNWSQFVVALTEHAKSY